MPPEFEPEFSFAITSGEILIAALLVIIIFAGCAALLINWLFFRRN